MPASVTMNGCSLNRWMIPPMTPPKHAPSSSTSATTAAGGQCACCSSHAEIIVDSASTDPTDRSIPPDRITKPMPTAITSRNALSIRRLKITCSDRKPG